MCDYRYFIIFQIAFQITFRTQCIKELSSKMAMMSYRYVIFCEFVITEITVLFISMFLYLFLGYNHKFGVFVFICLFHNYFLFLLKIVYELAYAIISSKFNIFILMFSYSTIKIYSTHIWFVFLCKCHTLCIILLFLKTFV